MRIFNVFISFIIFTLFSSAIFAAPQQLKIQYDDKYINSDEYTKPSATVLTGRVSQIQELPSGMYGMWQVKGTLLETNDYTKYSPTSSDIWVLRKDGNYVTLMNPQNGASATITVTEVEDNTATFVRGVKTYNTKDSEQVTLTLQGDTFYGTDLIVSEIKTHGVPFTSVARYRINGVKISGDTLFKRPANMRFHF